MGKKITILTLLAILFFACSIKAFETTLAFTGDNLFGGRMTGYISKEGYGFPYEHVADILFDADLTFGNLENPFTNYTKSTQGKSAESIRAGHNFIFKAPPEYAQILVDTGFDIVTLGNNHAMDYREQGLLDTLDVLNNLGVVYVGAGVNSDVASSPKVIMVNNIKVGFIGYSMIVPGYSKATATTAGTNAASKGYSDYIGETISELKKDVDIVVVTFHWGIEGQYYPATYQKTVAHKCIEAGADIIIGHHPHRIQGIEIYQGKVIAYSLGNFMFTGASHKVESFIMKVLLNGRQIVGVEVIPCWVMNGRPVPTTGDDLKVANKIIQISSSFKTNFETAEDSTLK